MPSPEIRAVAESIFAELLGESVLTTTIEAHREIKRGQAMCGICGTRCRAHDPIQPLASGASSTAASRESSPAKGLLTTTRPAGYPVGPEKGTGGGTGVGSGSGRMDASGNVFFDCLVCGRSITSARYAPHLASCLGFSGSTRRGASRMAAAKARLGTNDRASPSPYLASENDSDADSVGGGASKRKKLLNGKSRAQSPTKASLKKKFAHSGSAPPSAGRPPHPPSRLGRPPMGTKAHSASPFSPEKATTGASFREGSAGSVASAGAEIGRKTLPGMNRASVPPSAPPSQGSVATGSGSRAPSEAPKASPPPPPPPAGDESSEGDDDY
ncbi:uncharacterized protein LOC62_01G000492 [Vanrija pseudolonga]|uniref:SAGA-associated factor 11 n=1 Tax=Vanrija pseudolonga TaxID=143232 RepID=A0AAF0Y2F5_9TREE|nr:hypothetical protein LOC62_01G000492 [Vanrija pseudolonga]